VTASSSRYTQAPLTYEERDSDFGTLTTAAANPGGRAGLGAGVSSPHRLFFYYAGFATWPRSPGAGRAAIQDREWFQRAARPAAGARRRARSSRSRPEILPSLGSRSTIASGDAEDGIRRSIHVRGSFFFSASSPGRFGIVLLVADAAAVRSGPCSGQSGRSVALALGCAVLAAAIEDSDFQFDAVLQEVPLEASAAWSGVAQVPSPSQRSRTWCWRRDRRGAISGLSRRDDYRVFLVARSISMPMAASNLDVETARDTLASPLLALLGKSKTRPWRKRASATGFREHDRIRGKRAGRQRPPPGLRRSRRAGRGDGQLAADAAAAA